MRISTARPAIALILSLSKDEGGPSLFEVSLDGFSAPPQSWKAEAYSLQSAHLPCASIVTPVRA